MMKKILLTTLLVFFMVNNANAEKINPQHEKMRWCNKEAGLQALRGNERKAFMRQCLRKDTPMTKSLFGTLFEEKNTSATGRKTTADNCRIEATSRGLKGKERRSFIRECRRGI